MKIGTATILFAAAIAGLSVRNVAADPDDCCFGYEAVSGLNDGNCYKILLDLGPMAQNQARVACGAMFGGKLVTVKNKNDMDKVRKHFYDKHQDAIKGHALQGWDTGYWTAYMRDHECTKSELKKCFIDPYSLGKLSGGFFNTKTDPKQPDGQSDLSNRTIEDCVARKEFNKAASKTNGFDDYPCGKPHWAICMLPGVVAMKKNQNIYNTAWQNYQDVPADTCKQDWAVQHHNFFNMVIARAEQNGKDTAKLVGFQSAGAVTLAEIAQEVEDSIMATNGG